MSDAQTLVLLIALCLAAVAVIVWAWKTRAQDGPYVSDFVRPEETRFVPAAWVEMEGERR